MGVDAVQRASNGPEEHQAQRRLRVGHAERNGRTASHAGAHDVRPLNIQVVQQSLALRDVMRPRDALDTATGRSALATIEDDAGVLFR